MKGAQQGVRGGEGVRIHARHETTRPASTGLVYKRARAGQGEQTIRSEGRPGRVDGFQ